MSETQKIIEKIKEVRLSLGLTQKIEAKDKNELTKILCSLLQDINQNQQGKKPKYQKSLLNLLDTIPNFSPKK